jgi:hypothetical protein
MMASDRRHLGCGTTGLKLLLGSSFRGLSDLLEKRPPISTNLTQTEGGDYILTNAVR